MEKPKPHVSKKKERVLEDLVRLMKQYPLIGVLDMTNLPALQFQRIRAKLNEMLEFRMVKQRIMKIAFDRVKVEKKGIEKLKDKLEGIPALIFSKEDPFKLAKAIKQEVSAAPARPGQIAPDDITLPAGPTPFAPGPMIGELGAMGIKTKVESGKINILEDKLLVKKGEEITAKAADLLAKMGIEPMQIGFNLLLTYKDGEMLLKDVLFVDEKLYLDTLGQYARESLNLAMYIDYACKETVERMISKAENEAKAVSSVAKIEEVKEEPKPVEEKPVEVPKEEPKEEVKEEPVEVPKEEPKEEVKEEPKIEEKKEEPVEVPKEEKLKNADEKKVKVGLKPGKDITKDDIDLAAKQLQQIQDNLVNKK